MAFSDYLVERGLIAEDNLRVLRTNRTSADKPLVRLLEERGFFTPYDISRLLSDYYGWRLTHLETETIDPAAVEHVGVETARAHLVFPLRVEDGRLFLAMAYPGDVVAIDEVRRSTTLRIERLVAPSDQIRKAIDKYYYAGNDHGHSLNQAVTTANILHVMKEDGDFRALPVREIATDIHSPIAKTVDLILAHAVRSKASDIHIEPQEREVSLRYRVDGHLSTVMTIPSKIQPALVARIKILGEMDIAEQRRPQDGRARVYFDGHKVDLRIATIRTFFGEKVVIRLLNQDHLAVECIDSIGFNEDDYRVYMSAAKAKQGIVLITGATGSGKTTTLYSTLNHIKNGRTNITTIEDPIEYVLEGVNQTQVNPKIGVTFASAFRTILRQDPDVVLVGEIRDKETAEIAFRSSLTGHLVFSTLHTNGAVSAVTRLYDLGLEPYLVASALTCVVAQRLVRRVCPDCKELHTPNEEILNLVQAFIADDAEPLYYRGRGCERCSGTGYRGRAAVFEVLEITDDLRVAVSRRSPEDVLFKRARMRGFRTLIESAIDKVFAGVTTLEEVLTVVDVREEREILDQAQVVVERRKNPMLLLEDLPLTTDPLKSVLDLSEAAD